MGGFGGMGDAVAIGRGARLLPALVATLRFQAVTTPRLLRAHDEVVGPLVDAAVAGGDDRRHLRAALRSAGAKYGSAVVGYANMVGASFGPDVAVLAGAFARLYDDLIDEVDDPTVDDRVADLIQGRPYRPATDLEALLGGLFAALLDRLEGMHREPALSTFARLHDAQRRSRHQRDPTLTDDELVAITAAKGSLGAAVLFALVQPVPTPVQADLVRRIGAVVQELDDYQDLPADRAGGIRTPAGRGTATLGTTIAGLTALRVPMARAYGRRASRPFAGMLYELALAAFAARRLRWVLRLRPATRARPVVDVLGRQGPSVIFPARRPAVRARP